jgi:DNA-binding SARP family transcriptional activator/ABC-type branched-subunit amino acid transport system substrate-binding protein
LIRGGSALWRAFWGAVSLGVVEFGLLGLLQVEEGGDAVPIGAGKESALLALLLLHRDEPVSPERVVGELWGELSPASAQKSVQQYVSRLRRRLGAGRLATTPAGYVLHIEPGELDAERFGRLAGEGREALENGDAVLAERLFSDALALWRGPALADFRYDEFAQGEIRRLEAERRGVVVDRVDALLALGREELALPELENLIEEDPLWERPRAQLMLALYLAGRQSEALQVFQETRTVLDREVGLAPGSELQELQRAILNQDPALSGARRRLARPHGPRRGRRALATAGVLVAVGAAALSVVLTRGSPQVSRGDEVGAIAASGARGPSYTAVGATPSNIAAGAGGVWVLNADDRTITHIDPMTRRVTKTFATGGTPTDLAVGDGAVWIGAGAAYRGLIESNTITATVSRLDADSTRVTKVTRLPGITTADTPNSFAAASGVSGIAVTRAAVWAIDPDGSIARINPDTGTVVAKVLAGGATAIASGDAGVWFLTTVNGSPAVARIDTRTNSVGQVIPVQTSGLMGIAVGGGSVWASDPYDGVVWRIEPGPQPIARTLGLGFGVTQLAFGAEAVWAASVASGTVIRLDPKTDKIVTFHLAGTPTSLTVGAGRAWVTLAGAVRRGPLPATDCSPVASGGATPNVLIVSDLPLQGPRVGDTLAAAARFVFRSHGFRAGRYTVGYQSCDDSTARSQSTDFSKCATNARDFASTEKLVAVLGPYDSFCAQIEIPILDRSSLGPLALVSPFNTATGLTLPDIGGLAGAPGIYYPAHVRNYFRLAPPDELQGAAQAELASELGLRRIYILSDGDEYGEILARGFRVAARHFGLAIAGSRIWHPGAAGYASVVDAAAAAHPDGVLIGGYTPDAGALIRALRARVGWRLAIMGGDGLLTIPQLLQSAGPAADHLYLTIPVVAARSLTASGHKVLAVFERTQGGKPLPAGTYVPEMLQAAELIVDAIARSDGTRRSVIATLHRIHVRGGVYGSFAFDRTGDVTRAQFTILRVTGNLNSTGIAPDYKGAVVDRTVSAAATLLTPIHDHRRP